MAEKKQPDTDDLGQPTEQVEVKEEPKEEPKAKGKMLAVRLKVDYWDATGERRSASYTDKNGEFRETGAIIELPAEEARALVKTGAAERGDDY